MSKRAARRVAGAPVAGRTCGGDASVFMLAIVPQIAGLDRSRSVLSARAEMASLVVGIAGGTGSGKTTVAKTIAGSLPPGGVAMVEFDAYYRDLPDLAPEE